jgi:polar amino acid transport system substrate-binding protein
MNILLCLLLSLLAMQSSQAQQESVFVQVYSGPRSLDGSPAVDTGSEARDSTAELAAAILDKAGVAFDISIIPWSRAVQSLQSSPNVMVYSMIRYPEREALYEWIGLIEPVETWLYSFRGKLQPPPLDLNEARMYRIGLARRSAADNYLRSLGFEHLVYLGDANRAPMMLERDRIDLGAFTVKEVKGMEQRFGLEPGLLEPLVRLDPISTGTYFVMSKDTDPDLVARIRGAYEELEESGVVAEIMGSNL